MHQITLSVYQVTYICSPMLILYYQEQGFRLLKLWKTELTEEHFMHYFEQWNSYDVS